VQEAVRTHAKAVVLHVAADNDGACSLYEDFGFVCLRRHIDFYSLSPLCESHRKRHIDAYLYGLVVAKSFLHVCPPSPAAQLARSNDPASSPILARQRHLPPFGDEARNCLKHDDASGSTASGGVHELPLNSRPSSVAAVDCRTLWPSRSAKLQRYDCMGAEGVDWIEWYRFLFNRRRA
jgi:hypothetical protein